LSVWTGSAVIEHGGNPREDQVSTIGIVTAILPVTLSLTPIPPSYTMAPMAQLHILNNV